MTEREKAAKGYLFKQGDPVLAEERMRAKDLCFRLNQTLPSEESTRREILSVLIPHHGEKFTINSPFYCDYGTRIILGERFFANYNCKILDGGIVTFGDDVRIGPDCSFLTPSHALDPEMRREGLQIFLPVTVGDNVWFGANVTVLPGVTIGDNSVIAAGSVVSRDIPSGVLAAGAPCRVLRALDEEDKRKYPIFREEQV